MEPKMHQRLEIGSDEITLRAKSETLLAAEVAIPAGGGPPAMHRHPSEELYRIEAGELVIYREDERIVAGPGDVVHIASGQAHTVRNESGTGARAYVIFSPGTEMEGFVRAVAANPADVMALAVAHGIEFTGPVG
jgi:mannose-6-phosphate isomerase-like protein (cupin superfamily)